MVMKKEERRPSDGDSTMINQQPPTPTPCQVLRHEPVYNLNETCNIQCPLDHCTTTNNCTEETTVHTRAMQGNLARRALVTSNRLVSSSTAHGKTRTTKQLKIVKKYRRSKLHKVKKQEYNKLREMVPALKQKEKVSKVVVIEEAIKYIDELHSALVKRFRAKENPTTVNGVKLDPREVHGGNIRELIRRLLANGNPSSLPPTRIENVRTLPSFLQKLAKHKKSS